MNQHNITDLTFLKKFAHEDEGKMKKYIGMYMDHTPTMLAEMKTCLASGSYGQLKTTAHSISPQFHYMGMDEARKFALQIEDCCTNGEECIGKLAGMLKELEAICEQSFIELKIVLA